MRKPIIICLVFFLSAAAAVAAADPAMNMNESDYTIHGTTADQLRAQMNTLGPIAKDGTRNDALTTWYVSWHYNFGRSNGDCTLTRIRVTADINSVFPKWVEYDNADQALKSKWDNYIKLLRAHQQHHIDNGVGAAKDIYDVLMNAQSIPSCQELGSNVNAQGMEILRKYEDQGTSYDTATKNGQTEGLVFP